MKFSRIVLTLMAGAALVLVARNIRRRQASEFVYYDGYSDGADAEDEEFRFFPDNPVHSQDADHPMFI